MRRLADRIRAEGPITFADFMEAALYDPDEGFFEQPAVGEEGHFVTSPHISPVFGDLLARQCGEVWDLLGRPDPFVIVEAGAGDGTLARQILRAAGSVPEFALTLRYVCVERSRRGREAIVRRGLEAAGSLTEAPPAACIIANELLDNLPFHRVRERDGTVVEVMVALDGDRFVEVEAEPSPAAAAALREPPPPGAERPVSPAALAFVGEIRSVLARGYAFLFDYGFGPGETPHPVRAFRQHRVTDDLLSAPGSRDLTTEVDLGAIADEARRNGFQVWGPVSQRAGLHALGFEEWMQGVRARQAEAEASGDARTAVRLYSARQRATLLADEEHLGRLRLIALGTGELSPPASVR